MFEGFLPLDLELFGARLSVGLEGVEAPGEELVFRIPGFCLGGASGAGLEALLAQPVCLLNFSTRLL